MREVGAYLATVGTMLAVVAVLALCLAPQLQAHGAASQATWGVAAVCGVLMCFALAASALLTGEQRFRGGYVVRGLPAYLGGAAFSCIGMGGGIALVGHLACNDNASWMLTAVGVGMLSGGFLMPSVASGYVQNGLPEHRYFLYAMAVWLSLFGLLFFASGVLMILVGIGIVPRELLRG